MGPRYLWTRTVAGRTKGRQPRSVSGVAARRVGQLSPSLAQAVKVVGYRGGQRGDLRGPPHRTRRATRLWPGTGHKKGACDQIVREFTAEVERAGCARGRCAGILGADLVAVELAIRTAMTRLRGAAGRAPTLGTGASASIAGKGIARGSSVTRGQAADTADRPAAPRLVTTAAPGMRDGALIWNLATAILPGSHPRSYLGHARQHTTHPSSHPPSANTTVTG